MNDRGTPASILSIDVEDWFHILDLSATPGLPDWDRWPSRLEKNFLTLLDLAEEAGARATCFFLGWAARRYPHLAREAERRGHELASHGYRHQLADSMSPREFYDDVRSARQAIEDVAGRRVLGYRAPGFSVTSRVPWFFEQLGEAGYAYDASVFPGPHGHGGLCGAPLAPYRVGRLYEFPMSVVSCFGRPVCFFGGGYLRLFPLPVIRRMVWRVFRDGRPVILYVHPREIDPLQPRLPMPLTRRFRCYVNLNSTQRKLQTLLAELPAPATSFRHFLGERIEPEYGSVGLRAAPAPH